MGVPQSSRRRSSSAWLLACVAVVVIGAAGLYVGHWYFRAKEAGVAPANESSQPQLRIEEAPPTAGQQLYTNYCAACHGDKGEGDGPAARYLYPKPRNFTENRF